MQAQVEEEKPSIAPTTIHPLRRFLYQIIDPGFLEPSSFDITLVIDKILKSTPRLFAIANVFFAITFLIHAGVAKVFLGTELHGEEPWSRIERVGGFLIFKYLLVAAVLKPSDMVDSLILLSWYTLIGFFRSLAHLASSSTSHSIQSGQPPKAGVLNLLMAVLFADLVSAAGCVALFHSAGVNEVILLISDCAILAVEILCHFAKHFNQLLEENHQLAVAQVEEEQFNLHLRLQRSDNTPEQHQLLHQGDEQDHEEEEGEDNNVNVDHQFRRLDQQLERMEAVHAKRLSFLETVVFLFQILGHGLSILHYCHIWYLNTLTWRFTDVVLALHLYADVASTSKKIADWRNLR